MVNPCAPVARGVAGGALTASAVGNAVWRPARGRYAISHAVSVCQPAVIRVAQHAARLAHAPVSLPAFTKLCNKLCYCLFVLSHFASEGLWSRGNSKRNIYHRYRGILSRTFATDTSAILSGTFTTDTAAISSQAQCTEHPCVGICFTYFPITMIRQFF